ncbi:hypothetical protein CTK_C23540 [Clostridium tyrobutyricum]|nr:hypothetical protein CTK_C23540 [Clostridium tyrobutyricum]
MEGFLPVAGQILLTSKIFIFIYWGNKSTVKMCERWRR